MRAYHLRICTQMKNNTRVVCGIIVSWWSTAHDSLNHHSSFFTLHSSNFHSHSVATSSRHRSVTGGKLNRWSTTGALICCGKGFLFSLSHRHGHSFHGSLSSDPGIAAHKAFQWGHKVRVLRGDDDRQRARGLWVWRKKSSLKSRIPARLFAGRRGMISPPPTMMNTTVSYRWRVAKLYRRAWGGGGVGGLCHKCGYRPLLGSIV